MRVSFLLFQLCFLILWQPAVAQHSVTRGALVGAWLGWVAADITGGDRTAGALTGAATGAAVQQIRNSHEAQREAAINEAYYHAYRQQSAAHNYSDEEMRTAYAGNSSDYVQFVYGLSRLDAEARKKQLQEAYERQMQVNLKLFESLKNRIPVEVARIKKENRAAFACVTMVGRYEDSILKAELKSWTASTINEAIDIATKYYKKAKSWPFIRVGTKEEHYELQWSRNSCFPVTAKPSEWIAQARSQLGTQDRKISIGFYDYEIKDKKVSNAFKQGLIKLLRSLENSMQNASTQQVADDYSEDVTDLMSTMEIVENTPDKIVMRSETIMMTIEPNHLLGYHAVIETPHRVTLDCHGLKSESHRVSVKLTLHVHQGADVFSPQKPTQRLTDLYEMEDPTFRQECQGESRAR